jgi:two-component system response regulator VanR
MSKKILIVDDEPEIADLLEVYLTNENLLVKKCNSGTEAVEFLNNEQPDVAVLDVMLPDMSGFDICRKIREKYQFPVIMLTARVEDMDKIEGLTIGADDYITKPFNPLEVVARVKAQIRRYTRYNSGSQDADQFDVFGLVIDREKHICEYCGKTINLTPIEFDILWMLCENRGHVVSAEEIFEKVWGEESFDCNNTVMVHIRRLREKLGESAKTSHIIKTVWGVGYKIEG